MVTRSKRVKRGGRRNKSDTVLSSDIWTIYQSNIRGYGSKRVSFENIISSIKPSVICLNETHLKSGQRMKISGFNSFNRNRQNKYMGGISTSVANKDTMHTLKVKEGAEDDEFLITRHSQFVVPVNIVNVYGEQEGRSSKDDIQNRWNRIMIEIVKIESKNEVVVLLGDLNKHVGDIIEGNHAKVTFGGNLIRNMLKTEKYYLVNSSPKVEGGPFTRYDPADPTSDSKKSCLDLFIISKELLKYVDKLIIDKNFTFTPSRPISKTKMVYPDHFSSLLVFKNLPMKTIKVVSGPKFTLWNTNKEGGWEEYKKLTEDNVKLNEAAEDASSDPDHIMNKISKELNRIKHVSFGKVKLSRKPKENKLLEQLQMDKIKCYEEINDESERDEKVDIIDKEIAANLLTQQRINFEKEIQSMKELRMKKGRSAAIFGLKNKVVGPKKTEQEATTLIDPVTKKEVNTPEEIKRVSIQYCQTLLTNREPKPDFIEDLKMKDILHFVRMEEVLENDVKFTQELFDNSLKLLRKKSGGKYDFIVKSGQSLKDALYNLFKVIWELEKKPDTWRDTVLIQLYKGVGPRDSVDMYRNIHTKLEIPNFFGHIVATAAKPNIVQNMTPYQIGTKPGHRAQEHLFVIKSVIGLAEANNTAVALQLWDLSKYFDRESLKDGLNELYKSNVRGKVYKLLYELNKDTRISVRTPVGDTEQRETGEGWGQGTIEGAICSAVNLDNGVKDFFSTSEYEISYGDLALSPLLFQDDISRIAVSPFTAQMGNDKLEALAETKLLDFNMDKSCIIVIGNSKLRKKLEDDFESNPPLLYGQKMKQVAQEKYLGDQINCGGLAASVSATVHKRKGKVLQTIFDIRAVIDDCRSHVTGAITTGLEIWEMAAVPFLLNNSDSWTGIADSTITELDNLQNLFYRVLLQVPVGCPIPMLYWDCGGLLMRNRILKNKLLFLHHVATLSPDSVAKQVYLVQKRLELPGLLMECQEHLAKFQSDEITSYSKTQWKKFIVDKINLKNQDELLDQVKSSYKKISYIELIGEKCELKSYMRNLDLSAARDKFRIRSKMTKTVKMNYPSDKGYKADLWRCWHCPSLDTQSHIMTCPAYQHFREDKNLDNDQDLVKFFRQVIQLRDDMTTQ